MIASYKDPKIKEIFNNSFMSIPDGMPCVWVSKLKGSQHIKRCFGPEVFMEIMKISRQYNIKHFFYGGKENVAIKLKKNMEKLFPGVKIVGTYCPPFRPLNQREKESLTKIINFKKPHIVWVGISTPKQEIFMYENINSLDINLMFGVGAAFDYYTGSIKIAPSWIQNLGLEWLFRLIQEPRRLWKRYLDIVPKFIIFNLIEFISKFFKK